MVTADIEAAINSSAEKKEDLKKAFDALQSYSSSLFSFTLHWKDIEDHFSSIEKSIEARFRELKEFDSSLAAKNAVALPVDSKAGLIQDKSVILPRLELKKLCVKMDCNGLRSFIINNRKDIVEVRRELGPALLSAPEPVKLVLDSVDGSFPPKSLEERELIAISRTSLTLLECLHDLSLEIKPLEREKAKQVAAQLIKLLNHVKCDTSPVVLSVLHIVATFGLVDLVQVDDILDHVVEVARRKNIVSLCKSAALDAHIPALVDKLINRGKQIDAVKFVIAFNLTEKYPPASLLNARLEESKRLAQELRAKGNNSAQSKNDATAKEIAALKAVSKTVEEYNLGSVYSCEGFQKKIEELENRKNAKKPEKKLEKPGKKSEKKRGATANSASNSSVRGQMQQPEHPNKRHRPLSSTSSLFRAAHPFAYDRAQLGLVDLSPHAGLSGSNPLSTAPSLYNLGSTNLSSSSVGLGGSLGLSRYISSESLASAYYDRAVENNSSYGKSGLPPSYHSGFYF